MIHTVSFPGLGLEFTLNREAVNIFGFSIYWYAVIIVSGALLAWFYCSRKGPKLGISADDLIDVLNGREDIDGILCQLPLPEQFDEKAVLEAIDPGKDVDCFHPYNVGKLMIGEPVFLPCTPAGVMEMLDEYGIDPKGKHCVVVGRSNIVGKPQAMLLLHRHATVTVCHSRTPDLGAVTRQADILVAAVGKRDLITADMVKEGAVVIDVAMNKKEDGKLCGDVAYAEVAE